MKVALTLSYNGTHYFGSQIQKETKRTIFGTLEAVLINLGIQSKVIASGRTDKGVHASGQVCHFELPEYWKDLNKLKRVLNEMLPSSIHIQNIKEVSAEFHARYSAKRRVYRYILKQAPSNPFEADFVTFTNKNLDEQQLSKSMKLLQGKHDFKYFMKTGSDEKSTTRILYNTFAYKHKGYIILHFEANGFLRSQIRMMVASLLHLTDNEILEKLDAHVNHKVKPAPASGLYLAKIKY